jgi:AraC family transcriptional regulator, arabinose operon regulatory protein
MAAHEPKGAVMGASASRHRVENEAPPGQGRLDNAYVLGHHGFVYTSTRLASGMTQRHPAVLLLSVDTRPFRLTLSDGRVLRECAVMVPPRVARKLDARGVPLLSLNVMPSHAGYHVFRAMQHAGAMPLDRLAFNALHAEFEALLQGTATIVQAEVTFSRVVAEAQRQLPPAPTPDPKALALIRMLDADPTLGLDELARRLGHTHQVMSRLFSSAVGMSLRDYQNWLKQRRVFDVLYSRRSLTQVAYLAGFADSPQFTRTFQRWYGQTPSAARDPKRVRVFIHGASNGAPGQPETG